MDHPSIHPHAATLILICLAGLANASPVLVFTPSPAPLTGEEQTNAPSGSDPISDAEQERFGRSRWPNIIQGNLWAQGQSRSKLPGHAVQLMPELKKVFQQEGLPSELAWVAEVESMLKTNAVSKSGALGLFQFKRPAAKRFNLLKDSEDFREHPEPSARAAAQYLTHLYARFQEWPLAVAAYNAGEGCVEQLLKKYEAKSYNQIAERLPPQTQVYVIKVMRTLSLREKVSLSALPAPARKSEIGNPRSEIGPSSIRNS